MVNPSVNFHPYVELYDLKSDPWELHDVSSDPRYAQVRKDLLSRLHRQMRQTDDPLLQVAVTSPHHHKAMAILEAADGPGEASGRSLRYPGFFR